MNRQARRAAASKQRHKTFDMLYADLKRTTVINVDGKDTPGGPVVMLYGNTRGQRLIEELWPEVEWTRDEVFENGYPPDWRYTHVRLTRLPPDCFAETRGLNARADAHACAVAMALQAHTEPHRVVHWSGEGRAIKVNFYKTGPALRSIAREMGVEYVAPGWHPVETTTQ